MRYKSYSFILCFLIIFSMLLSVSLTSNAEESSDKDTKLEVPRITVVTEDGNGTTLQKADGYVNADITITDNDGAVLSDKVSFKVRGNTTSMPHIVKKAYTFKFDKKKDVLGMGKGKKWALIANAFDPTLLRNYTAFELAYELGLEYTSNQKFVELWVDGSYRGCYTLYEPVQEGKDRVDIDIESNDGKKDFLLEYEAQRVEDDVTYFTVGGLRFISSEPEEPNDDQLQYIVDTMTNIISTLRNGSKEEIEAVIDVSSFSKYYLLNELFKTYDFDMSSVFFYYKNGKLFAGPPWDYDLSTGNVNGETYNSYRIQSAYKTDGAFAASRNIYKFISDKEWFIDAVKDEYNTHYDYIERIYTDGGLLDSLLQEYGDLFDRNYAQGVAGVRKHWLNLQKPPLPTYRENYDYLKNWLNARNEWLSEYYEVPFGLLGDVNSDGDVDVSDAALILRKQILINVPVFTEVLADVDSDGETTVLDATFIQRYDIRVETPYKIGEKLRIK